MLHCSQLQMLLLASYHQVHISARLLSHQRGGHELGRQATLTDLAAAVVAAVAAALAAAVVVVVVVAVVAGDDDDDDDGDDGV